MKAQEHRITIPYFPSGWKYCLPLIWLGAYQAYVWGYPIGTVLLIIFSFLIISSHYVTVIDNSRKVCEDYLELLWIPFNKEVKKYNAIDRIFITKATFKKQLSSRISSRTVKWEDYTGTLLFDDNTKMNLITHEDPKKLMQSLRVIADMLGVGIEDRTRREPQWVH